MLLMSEYCGGKSANKELRLILMIILNNRVFLTIWSWLWRVTRLGRVALLHWVTWLRRVTWLCRIILLSRVARLGRVTRLGRKPWLRWVS